MDIGTAKTPVCKRNVPLRMVDICDPCDDYSVQQFQISCRNCVDGLLNSGRPAILCGGTGLYLDSVIDEMNFPSGEKGDQVRSRYESALETLGPKALHELLMDRDPDSAALIHPNNSRRVIRALEMLDEGKSYATHHEGLLKRPPHYDVRIWAITMDRERLYARINALLDEVSGLRAAGLSKERTAGQAIGYKEILDYLDGLISMGDAVELIKARTRRYAKRQLSWLRRDGRANWIDYDMISEASALKLIVDDYRKAKEAR